MIRKATMADLDELAAVAAKTIAEVYPNFYPPEGVQSFLTYHGAENIGRDIAAGNVYASVVDGKIIGTGCADGAHITRVYFLPESQGHGYGKEMLSFLEEKIAETSDTAYLDAALSACLFYEKFGYRTVKHGEFPCPHGAVIVFAEMSKRLK